MARLAQRISHIAVRIIAVITLIDLFASAVSIKHGSLGKVLIIWAFAASLLLPIYVGAEIVWVCKTEGPRRSLWIDAILAASCFCLLVAFILYGFTHHVML